MFDFLNYIENEIISLLGDNVDIADFLVGEIKYIANTGKNINVIVLAVLYILLIHTFMKPTNFICITEELLPLVGILKSFIRMPKNIIFQFHIIR